MGNKSSNLLAPCSDLKLKNGDKLEPLPCPMISESTSFDKLFATGSFKDFFLSNMDNTSLINIIVQNSNDDAIVLKGIDYFQSLNPDSADEIASKISKMQNFSVAGINVSKLLTFFNI